MTLIQNPIIGLAKNQIGNIIIYKSFDNFIMRAKPIKIKKSKSAELARNRSSFSFAKKFASYHLQYLSNFFFTSPPVRSFYLQFLSEFLKIIFNIRNNRKAPGELSHIGSGNISLDICSFFPNYSFSEISIWLNDFNPDWISYPVINFSFFTLNCSSFSTSVFNSSFSFFEDVITLPVSISHKPGDKILFIIQFRIFDTNNFQLFNTAGISSFYIIPSI